MKHGHMNVKKRSFLFFKTLRMHEAISPPPQTPSWHVQDQLYHLICACTSAPLNVQSESDVHTLCKLLTGIMNKFSVGTL
jgi:hypothetical protein